MTDAHSEELHFYPVRFMFKKQPESPNFKEVETIIGRSVKVEGDFVGEGDVVVEGHGSICPSSFRGARRGPKGLAGRTRNP